MGGSLMIGSVATRISVAPRLIRAPGAVRRGLIAGSAWGVAVAVLLIAREAWTCGGVCLPDAALTTVLSLAAGIVTIGPLAAFGRRSD
jgi:hypothetical protein